MAIQSKLAMAQTNANNDQQMCDLYDRSSNDCNRNDNQTIRQRVAHHSHDTRQNTKKQRPRQTVWNDLSRFNYLVDADKIKVHQKCAGNEELRFSNNAKLDKIQTAC